MPDFFTHLQVHFQSFLQRKAEHYVTLAYECSKVFAIAYHASASYRLENERLYKIDSRRLIVEPWNSSLDLVQILQKQLETCIDALRKGSEQSTDPSSAFVRSVANPQKFLVDFKSIFCELANATLTSFHCLKSYYAVMGDTRHADSLWERYQVVQTKAIDSMRKLSVYVSVFFFK